MRSFVSASPTAVIAALALSVIAAPALAEEAISTAGGAAAPTAAQDTAVQIDRWISQAPPIADEQPEPAPRDRKIHGEVGVAVGTGGYRSGYVISHMPLGETGSLTLAIGQSKNDRRGYYYDRGYNGGLMSPLGPMD